MLRAQKINKKKGNIEIHNYEYLPSSNLIQG